MGLKPVIPITAPFKGILSNSIDRIKGPTPPAKIEYLRGVNLFVHHCATNPYCVTALNFNAADHNNSESQRHMAQVINIAAKSGRACIGRAVTFGTAGSITNAETYSDASGATANDKIVIPCEAVDEGTEAFPITWKRGIDVATEGFDATPAAPMDRQYELTTALAPRVEYFTLNRGHSWGMILYTTSDMSGL